MEDVSHRLRDVAQTCVAKRSTAFAAGIITSLAALLSLFDITMTLEMRDALTTIANGLLVLFSLLF